METETKTEGETVLSTRSLQARLVEPEKRTIYNIPHSSRMDSTQEIPSLPGERENGSRKMESGVKSRGRARAHLSSSFLPSLKRRPSQNPSTTPRDVPMPSHLFLILLAFLWVVFQLGKRSPFTRRRLQHLLRRSSSSSPNLDLDDDDDETLWTVKTTLIGIQVSTTTFNEIPSRILGLLGKDQRRWLARGYDLGILWGMVGMLATIGILSWEGVTFGVWLLRVVGNSRSGEAVGKVVKRALEEGTSSGGGGKLSEGIIRPLVGLFLPSVLLF